MSAQCRRTAETYSLYGFEERVLDVLLRGNPGRRGGEVACPNRRHRGHDWARYRATCSEDRSCTGETRRPALGDMCGGDERLGPVLKLCGSSTRQGDPSGSKIMRGGPSMHDGREEQRQRALD